MPPRGRPRKLPVNLPIHIDYSKAPKGIYWDASGNGRWYVLNPHPEGRGHKAKTVAQASARMSDLHLIAERRTGAAVRGTISYVIDLFESGLTFSQLASSTQQHYRDYAKAIRLYPLKNGTVLGDAVVDRLTPGVVRRLVDVIAQGDRLKSRESRMCLGIPPRQITGCATHAESSAGHVSTTMCRPIRLAA